MAMEEAVARVKPTPNHSLDMSGGNAFLNLLGEEEAALIRATASTQPLGGTTTTFSAVAGIGNLPTWSMTFKPIIPVVGNHAKGCHVR
jgi:hypothetical protein